MIRKNKIWLFSTLVLFASCKAEQEVVVAHKKQPRFINDIYFDQHNSTASHVNGIDNNSKVASKGKYNKAPNNRLLASKLDNEPGKVVILEKYASMMSIEPAELQNEKLYNFIEEWYGVEHVMGGCDKTGIDCSAFVKKLYEDVFGMELTRSSREQYEACEHLKRVSALNEGDLVFFKTAGRHISHVGVYLHNDYFVHASNNKGIVISSLKEEYWQKHFVGAGKVAK